MIADYNRSNQELRFTNGALIRGFRLKSLTGFEARSSIGHGLTNRPRGNIPRHGTS